MRRRDFFLPKVLLIVFGIFMGFESAQAGENPVVPGGKLGEFRHGTYPSPPIGDFTHPGVDIVAPCGSDIYAYMNGQVVDVVNSKSDKNFDSLGYMVLIQQLKERSTGLSGLLEAFKGRVTRIEKDYYTIYLHMQEPPEVQVGDEVSGGKTKIGKVGDSGKTIGGCHTHFEIRHFPGRFSKWGNIYGPGDQRESEYFKEGWSDPIIKNNTLVSASRQERKAFASGLIARYQYIEPIQSQEKPKVADIDEIKNIKEEVRGNEPDVPIINKNDTVEMKTGADITPAMAENLDKELLDAAKQGQIGWINRILKEGADLNAKNEIGKTPLIIVSELGNAKIAKLLIDRGADVNAQSEGGWTALMMASNGGHTEITQHLIDKGANVDARNKKGETALMMASSRGHSETVKLLSEKSTQAGNTPALSEKAEKKLIVKFINAAYEGKFEVVRKLLDRGIDVNIQSGRYKRTALGNASWRGHIEIVKLLLEKGADPNIKQNNITPLEYALRYNHMDIVNLLIAKGADVNVWVRVGFNRKPFFTWALLDKKDFDFAKLLIDKGADINAIDNYGRTALNLASEKGEFIAVKLLIDNGANLNLGTKTGETPLTKALRRGHLDIAKLLINEGANVKAINNYGQNLLPLALNKDYVEIAKLLMDKGADVNAKDENGWPPLMIAISKGHTEIVKLLTDKGADVNVKNKKGETALTEATKNGQIEIVQLLIDKGADVNGEDDFGDTPLLLASNKAHTNISHLLIKKGAKIDASNKFGITPLLAVAINGSIDLVKTLIRKGAYIHARDRQGKTILMYAAEYGHLEVVKILVKEGAEVNANFSLSGSTKTALMLAETKGHFEVAKFLRSKGAK